MHSIHDENLDRQNPFQTRDTDPLPDSPFFESFEKDPEPAPAPTPSKAQSGSSVVAFATRLFWFSGTALIAIFAWHMMPQVIEDYQYAMTKGRIRAEYENAVLLLQDNPLESVSNAYELVAQKIRPSVVSIQTTVEAKRESQDLLLPRSFQPSMRGQGSGVIVSAEGYILTNAHVVKDAKSINIILHDRRSFAAQQVGRVDEMNDLAVLKIDAPDLVPAEWGDSDALDVGSIVWAIGSPFGYDQSVTSGIVSAKNRIRRFNDQPMNVHQQMLQTDAAVNPGNSGGPLVNAQGQVVGINTAIHGKQFQGISFAVPSVIARYVFEKTVEYGYVSRSIIGVRVSAVFQRHLEQLELPDIDGALVMHVERNYPASKAGLQTNDVIRSWNGVPIGDYGMLYRLADMTEPNTEVTLSIWRDGQERDVILRPAERTTEF